MAVNLNDILLTVPLYQLSFLTPFLKENLYYEAVVQGLSNKGFTVPTLLVIQQQEDLAKLNRKKIVDQLIQDTYLEAIVINSAIPDPVRNEMLQYFQECQIPIILINQSSLSFDSFEAKGTSHYYTQLSVELDGFFKRGFMSIASNLSMAFQTPFIFLDENAQPLWHTGPEKEVEQYFHTNRHSASDKGYEYFPIHIAGKLTLTLVARADLNHWQKSVIHKYTGFTAVNFQTDEVIREQNDRFKEFFIYELLYRKFESKKVLIKQGKTWGWNLEKPHHLLLIELEMTENCSGSLNLDEMAFLLESERRANEQSLIIFPFQDGIVVLVEDGNEQSPGERKQLIEETSHWLEAVLQTYHENLQFNIGIGKWYLDSINLNKSYQEAKIALQFGKAWYENRRIYHMNDLGVLHLLTGLHRELLYDFCQEYLSPLIQSDKEHGTEYLKTLKVYTQYHGVIVDVSDAMFIHPNTLRKRLKKIESMIGINLQNLEELLNVMVAVKVYYSFSL